MPPPEIVFYLLITAIIIGGILWMMKGILGD
jgi:heme/copper-type cytochrome/quinol oxidase subunit 4